MDSMQRTRWLFQYIFLAVGTFGIATNCGKKRVEDNRGPKVEIQKGVKTMAIDQKLFLNVPLNSNEKNPCSPPEPGPTWRGILIQMPIQVKFKRGVRIGTQGAFAAIPICGYYLLDVPASPVKEPMRLFAVDKRTGKVYSGDVKELDPSPEAPPPESEPLSPEELKGLASGGYFNPNLADFVRLPEISAVYDVHVEFRKFPSNVATVEMVEVVEK